MGCSGWQYRDWRGVLYPPGLAQREWLAEYARRFEVVEVNATHYRLPTRDAVARWVEQTPPAFTFSVKVSRYLTHMRKLTGVAAGMAMLLDRIEPMIAAGRAGPLLWQLPPWLRRDDDRLAAALAELPAGRHAFEFRHPSWFVDETWALLRAHGVAAVLADDARRPLPAPPRTADFAFVRLHFGARGRRGNYSRAELDAWAVRVAALAAGDDAFCFFNNDWEGFAPRDARTLVRALERGGG